MKLIPPLLAAILLAASPLGMACENDKRGHARALPQQAARAAQPAATPAPARAAPQSAPVPVAPATRPDSRYLPYVNNDWFGN